MPHLIDLEGLPEPVAGAIAETVLSLKTLYRDHGNPAPVANRMKDLPSRPGRAIGHLSRADIYDER
jgi:hypothetical protein